MPKFAGFQERDFDGIAGTDWRSRKALGGVLAKELAKELGRDCQSWGISRRPEVFLAKSEHYQNTGNGAGRPFAKMFVAADSSHLNFGFYIEAPKNVKQWTRKYSHWGSFHGRLRRHMVVQHLLLDLMLKHNLSCGDYYASRDEHESALGCMFRAKSGRLQSRNFGAAGWEDTTLRHLTSRIAGLADGSSWVNLHVFESVPRQKAIKLGTGIVPEISKVLCDLSPLYLLSIA